MHFWGWGDFRLRPLPAPTDPKFLGEYLGPLRRCQIPLELGQKLLPVSSYGGLNIAKIASLGANISTTRDPIVTIFSAVDKASLA